MPVLFVGFSFVAFPAVSTLALLAVPLSFSLVEFEVVLFLSLSGDFKFDFFGGSTLDGSGVVLVLAGFLGSSADEDFLDDEGDLGSDDFLLLDVSGCFVVFALEPRGALLDSLQLLLTLAR